MEINIKTAFELSQESDKNGLKGTIERIEYLDILRKDKMLNIS